MIDGQIPTIIIYRLTVHPLAKCPGPLLAKITNLYAVYHAYVGDLHLDMLRCHELYGKLSQNSGSMMCFCSNCKRLSSNYICQR